MYFIPEILGIFPVLCSDIFGGVMQFDCIPEKGIVNAVFILRSLQEEFHVKWKEVVYVSCGPGQSFWQSTD